MTPHRTTAVRSVTVAFVLLAGITGLLWPKSNIQAEDKITPIPVRTQSYPSPIPTNSNQLQPGLPPWLRAEEDAPPPAWRLRGDGLWVPWTMEPPAWLTTIAAGYVMAETVPLPPERPKDKTVPKKGEGEILSSQKRGADTDGAPQKRIPSADQGLCARHGLKKVYTDQYRWRCR